jgi:hypothetical protein
MLCGGTSLVTTAPAATIFSNRDAPVFYCFFEPLFIPEHARASVVGDEHHIKRYRNFLSDADKERLRTEVGESHDPAVIRHLQTLGS